MYALIVKVIVIAVSTGGMTTVEKVTRLQVFEGVMAYEICDLLSESRMSAVESELREKHGDRVIYFTDAQCTPVLQG